MALEKRYGEAPPDQFIVDPFKLRVHYDREKIDEMNNSITFEGLQMPLKVWRNEDKLWIIDGTYRYLALKDIGYTPLPDGERSNNIPYILMSEKTTYTQALLVAVICNWQRTEFYFMDRANSIQLLRNQGMKDAVICDNLNIALKNGYPGSQFYRYLEFIEYVPKEVKDIVLPLVGKFTHRHAEALVKLKDMPDKQRELAELIMTKNLSGPQAISWARRTLNPPVRKLPLPPGKYACIVIDPPWPMEKIVREERPNQGADYPVMEFKDINALPIKEKANKGGCHIYLWVTHKFLPKGLELFKKWGIKYQCVLTWVKPTGMTPFSWMYNTEHVLFGRIGNLKLLEMGLKLSFEEKVKRHSRKPDAFYVRVRKASPEPRLNMFAREDREGFERWPPNEV